MPRKRKETRSIPPLVGVASLDATTADPEARTVEMTFYSGAPVFRLPLFDDPYELEFDMTQKAAHLDRLNAGAPLIDSHDTYSGVKSILGVVEKAWLSKEGGRAKVRFSSREEVQPVFQDVLDGVIRNVSMGTYIYDMEEVTEKGADIKRLRATSWEPYEISLVAVPADSGAQILQAADDAAERTCSITYRAEGLADAHTEGTMKIQVRLLADSEYGKLGEIVECEKDQFNELLMSEDLNPPAPPAPKETPPRLEPKESAASMARKVDSAIAADEEYATEVRRLADHFGLDRVWAQRKINSGQSVEALIAECKDERAKRNPKGPNDIGFGGDDFESAVWKRDRIGEALVARATRQAPPEQAKQYADLSLVEAAYECLAWDPKRQHRGLGRTRDKARIVDLALHTTDDFPLILGNVLNKILLPAYEAAQPTYRMIGAERTFNDFRPHRFLRGGDFPAPMEVNEHGEYQYGSISENQETVTLLTYGRIIGFSRQMLVNDDLGALEDMATKAAIRTSDFENATFFSTCILAGSNLGPDLSDGNAVYNAAHVNIANSGADLDVAAIGAARALMMEQTSLDGIKLNVLPTILLVPPERFTTAEQLTTSIAAVVSSGDSGPNPFQGRLTAVSDANLTDANRWYLLADPARLPNYVYGGLGGNLGPRVDTRQGFEIDGIEFKLSLDFACGAIDFRGGVTDDGAA